MLSSCDKPFVFTGKKYIGRSAVRDVAEIRLPYLDSFLKVDNILGHSLLNQYPVYWIYLGVDFITKSMEECCFILYNIISWYLDV